MIGVIGLIILAVILLLPYLRSDKYGQIERQRSMRRAIFKIQGKHRPFGL
jgi:hypothetical protein